jgi:hypothetical protein
VVNGGGAGFGIAASDGVLRCTIPNGTTIPARGHFLCANAGSPDPGMRYSLSNYGGTGATTPDASYTDGIANNVGIALFNNTTSFTAANRLDAVGPSTEANPIYKEGMGYAPVSTAAVEQSLYRDLLTNDGRPRDTGNNAADFRTVAVNANASLGTASLGAPGPEKLTSPLTSGGGGVTVSLISPCVAATASPNRVRDLGAGTLSIRRRLTNNTGANVTRLRLRVTDLTTAPAPDASTAVLAATTSSSVLAAEPCGPGTVSIQGLTLEQPPAQAQGGGLNSSLSVGTITVATPLANGSSIDVNLLLNVNQVGNYRFCLSTEALPGAGTGTAFGEFGSVDAPASTVQSCQVPTIPPFNIAPPSISGAPVVGQTLIGDDGSWSGDSVGFARQWRRCDAAGANCADIAGATAQTYAVAPADVGSTLLLRVTGSNSAGTVSADSAPTAAVTAALGVTLPGGPPLADPAPTILAASISPSAFRASRLGASIAAPVGGRVFYRLSEPARVRFTVERVRPGRRVGRRCVAPTRRNRRRPRCTRYPVLRGSFTHGGRTGANSFRFTGRLAGRRLALGRHRLVAVATDAAGGRSRARRVSFRIVRR